MRDAAARNQAQETQERRDFLVFRVGAQEFCVDVLAVKEVRGWTPTTSLPKVPSFLRGVTNLRGTVLPIVDLGDRLQIACDTAIEDRIVVVVWIDRKLLGLLVDAVCDIVTAGDKNLQAMPDLTGEPIHTSVTSLITVDGRVIGLVALDQILADTRSQNA
ncbi:MAG: purine-binding chemotaxis protein CheW [Proteobacteria bacterium]|nr:purine-binding chemotaxis protein CheW [Pseudomonadota bacterium]